MADAFFSGRLPLPPGINGSYKIVTIRPKGKKPFNRLGDTPEAAAFRRAAARQLGDGTAQTDWSVVEAIQTAKEKHKHIPLRMHITFFFQTMWKRDIDGGEKHVQDAICKHLKINDNLIVHLTVEKQVDRNDPRVEVQLSIAEEQGHVLCQ